LCRERDGAKAILWQASYSDRLTAEGGAGCATRSEVRSNCGAHRGTTQIAKNCFKPVADSKFAASSDHHDIIRQAVNNRNDDPIL